MTTDTRTAAEKRYDDLKSGSIYTKPSTLLLAAADFIDSEQAICDEIDRIIKPEQLQITRHTHTDDGELASCPWTTYALGEAEIDIHDAGGGNVCVGQHMITFSKDDSADLLDLAQLLANETVLEALDPTTDGRDTPLSPVEARAIAILYPDVVIVPSRDAAHREERWLNILEFVAELPEPEKSAALSYMQGVLDAMTGNRQ